MTSGHGIALGRAFGVPVYLRPSWFLIAAVVAYFFTPRVRNAVPGIGTSAVAVALAFAVLLLASIFVHELAHAAAAALTGTPATHIVLDLWGGHTSFDTESRSPGRSIAVAVVGPLSNGLIAVGAGAVALGLDRGSVLQLLVVATAGANGFVAVFNALPGLPLDGGRVLEGLVWRVTGDRRTGTLAAGWCGRVVAVGLVLFTALDLARGGSLGGSIWLLLVAGLLWQGATQAISTGALAAPGTAGHRGGADAPGGGGARPRPAWARRSPPPGRWRPARSSSSTSTAGRPRWSTRRPPSRSPPPGWRRSRPRRWRSRSATGAVVDVELDRGAADRDAAGCPAPALRGRRAGRAGARRAGLGRRRGVRLRAAGVTPLPCQTRSPAPDRTPGRPDPDRRRTSGAGRCASGTASS